jgi:N-acetylneuraminic acid mutarotase
MVFNPTNQEMVLFGGYKDTEVFDDAWMYDGQNWQPIITKSQPPARNGHNMFFDQTRGKVILFGGLNGVTFYNDMWELIQP